MGLACQLVKEGILTPEHLVEKIALNPAKIAGIEASYHQTGGAVLVDPNLTWTVTKESMISQGKNTPFINSELTGKVEQVYF